MDTESNRRFRRASVRACQYKRHYPTWAEAQKVVVRQTRKDGWDHMEPYRCRGCGQYAVGHGRDDGGW